MGEKGGVVRERGDEFSGGESVGNGAGDDEV